MDVPDEILQEATALVVSSSMRQSGRDPILLIVNYIPDGFTSEQFAALFARCVAHKSSGGGT
jgi:hypothetical protein